MDKKTNTVSNIQSREDKNGLETSVDTAQEAAALSRKVLEALARNFDEPALSSDFSVEDVRTGSVAPIKSVKPGACDDIRNHALDAALQFSCEHDLLGGAQNENLSSEKKLEELMYESNISSAPIVNNSNVLNFVKAIDDVNASFCGSSCQQNDICEASNNAGELGSSEAENDVRKETSYKDYVEALENLLDGTGDYSSQAQNLESAPSRDVQLGHENHWGQDSFQSTLSAYLANCEHYSLERKNARDRRRAIARRRTLLRRRAEENARMQKVMENLLYLPEEERQKELKKMEYQQRENERRRKTEEKRRLGRQAVERCRGKAGLSQKALQMKLKSMRNENQKLRQVLILLSRSGVVSAEELQRHRIVIAKGQSKSGSSNSVM